ncbi:MAG TPA: glutathione S-transferase family protein [Alphaproteobacteria bacterium]|nr:glutathione S-transferase family protein [Alphaproteobacteria bacterium]
MAESLALVIGDKRFSSWSLRPWLLLKEFGIAFREERITLRQADTGAQIARHGLGLTVPILKDGEVVVWDSLAIAEYVAERFPDKAIWPRDAGARAFARSLCAEMHSSFQALRTECPMNILARVVPFDPVMGVKRDVARIELLWATARERYGQSGKFLFGEFGTADSFYAPVVTRFRTYGIKLSAGAQAYCDAVFALEGMREWERGACQEMNG